MADHSTNYNFELPAGNEFYDVNVGNSNFHIVDDTLNELQSLLDDKKELMQSKVNEAIAEIIGGASDDMNSIEEILSYANNGFVNFESRLSDYLPITTFDTMQKVIKSYDEQVTSKLKEREKLITSEYNKYLDVYTNITKMNPSYNNGDASNPMIYYINDIDSKIGDLSLLDDEFSTLQYGQLTQSIDTSSIYTALNSIMSLSNSMKTYANQYISDDNKYRENTFKNVVMVDLDNNEKIVNDNSVTINGAGYKITIMMQKYRDSGIDRYNLSIIEDFPILLSNMIIENELTYESDSLLADSIVNSESYSYLIVQIADMLINSCITLNVVNELPENTEYVVLCKFKLNQELSSYGQYSISFNFDDIPTYYNTAFILQGTENMFKTEYEYMFDIKNKMLTNESIESGIGLCYDKDWKYVDIANDLQKRCNETNNDIVYVSDIQRMILRETVKNENIQHLDTFNVNTMKLTNDKLSPYLKACTQDYNLHEETFLDLYRTDSNTTIASTIPHIGNDGILETYVYTSKNNNGNKTKYDTVEVIYHYHQSSATYRCRGQLDITTNTFKFYDKNSNLQSTAYWVKTRSDTFELF